MSSPDKEAEGLHGKEDEKANLRNPQSRARPHEKLHQKVTEALSDVELLAILLGSGTREHVVMEIAERILKIARSKR
jgi:DNA repair protein RadC